MLGFFALTLVLALLAPQSASAVERRKDQFPTEPSYLIVPLPYSLPGIGEGFFIPVFFSNIAHTTTDAYALLILGDAQGQTYGLEELHLIDKRLMFDTFYQTLNKAVVNNYATRGMDSAKDDYSLIELSQVDSYEVALTLTFLERQLEFTWREGGQKIQLDRLRDKDGVLVAELSPPYTANSVSRSAVVQLDLTDDFQDPRRGVRWQSVWANSPSGDSDRPDFYVLEHALTGYVPLGTLSTLALHYFRSDAVVRRPGQTDLNVLRADLNLNCGGNPECLARETELAVSFRDANLNGSSTSLGGEQRLRAYPMGRFQGAHTVYYAAELRWNLTEEVTPFDYFIWKDVRTGVQVAFFYEVGGVSETRDTLGDKTRSDFGIGLRMIAGSGAVYRADIATGDEGTVPTIIVNYPF